MPKQRWEPMWVTLVATGEKACIKSNRFNPELHAKVEGKEEAVEESSPKVETVEEEVEVKEEEVLEEHVCEDCGKEAKSKAGLVSHKRYCNGSNS